MIRFALVVVVVLSASCGSIALDSTNTRDGGTGGGGALSSGGGDASGSDGARVDADATDGGSGCATRVDCPAGLSCIDGTCVRKARGAACAGGDECDSNFCADGVCCGTACTGGCVACDLPGRAGTCWPVDKAQSDPRGICVNEGEASCGNNGTCDGFGGCSKYAAGTVCVAAGCDGNTFEGARLCDAKGACGPAPTPRACGPYACNASSCLDACISDLGCAAPSVCIGGACRISPALVASSSRVSDEIGGSYPDAAIDELCLPGSAVIGYDVTTTTASTVDVVEGVRTVCGALRIAHVGGILSVEVGVATAVAAHGTPLPPTAKLRCPTNQVVVGYEGRNGAFVDQIAFSCAPLLVAGSQPAVALGAATEIGPVGGGGGGPHGPTDCGSASIAVGTRTLADSVLKKLSLLCASVSLQ